MLDISQNRLGMEGSCALAADLPKLGSLERIVLRQAELDEGLAVLVANGIMASGTLKRVEMDGNRVGSLAATALMYWSMEEDRSIAMSNCGMLTPISGSRHLWWTSPEHLHALS